MVITAIERQKRRPERVNIFIDGEFALGIHESVLLRHGLRKGDPVDEAALHSLQHDEEFSAAKEKALRLISYRLRSEQELRKRLAEKEFAPDVIQHVVDNLRQASLLDDRQFAKAFVHDLILRKKAGHTLLQRELRKKGIAPDIIENVLNETVVSEEEEERALAAASTLLARYTTSRKQSDKLKQRQRIVSYLARRGYDFGTIGKITRKLFTTNPDEPEPETEGDAE